MFEKLSKFESEVKSVVNKNKLEYENVQTGRDNCIFMYIKKIKFDDEIDYKYCLQFDIVMGLEFIYIENEANKSFDLNALSNEQLQELVFIQQVTEKLHNIIVKY